MLEDIEGANVCSYYIEHFIITDEGYDLTKDISWEGNTLEEIEEWLKEPVDILD